MSTGMYGLDPVECRDLVRTIKRSVQQLESAGTEVNRALARTGWQGPDSQRFRAHWPANLQRLRAAATGLDHTAATLLREIAEQERASAADGGALGNGESKTGGDDHGFWDDIVDAGRELWGDVTDGVDHLGQGLEQGVEWVRDTLHDLLPAPVENFFLQLGHLGLLGMDLFRGNPPSISALTAQAILAGGTALDLELFLRTGGLIDLHLFDDGQPYAGTPIAVGDNTPRPELTLPGSLSEIFQSVADSYAAGAVPGTDNGDIRILSIAQPDGSSAYIVNVPGTEEWAPDGSGTVRDLTGNLLTMAGQSSAAQQAVVLAMQRAGIPPGAPVMLAGHSQGGMLAIALASDPDFMAQYNVTNVMTVGSPVDGAQVDPRVQVLELQHKGDLVPQLDLGGELVDGTTPSQPANVTIVTMADPPPNTEQDSEFRQSGGDIGADIGRVAATIPGGLTPGEGATVGNVMGQSVGAAGSDFVNNHDFNNYVDSIAQTERYPGIAAYQNDPSMAPFITADRTRVTAVDVPIGRD